MLHTVVVDAQALAALETLFLRTGTRLPRSAPVDRRHGLDWHAIPIDAATITAIQCLRTDPDEPLNDTVRAMLDLPPLTASPREAA